MQFDFDINFKDEVITIHKHDEEFIDIPLERFWVFVRENDLNDYCNDYHNPSEFDGHGQDVGKYDKQEYFDLSYETIKADLSKYLLTPKFKNYF
jgi:hypothetical protein